MYSSFKIFKLTGTYSDIIEASGLANLLSRIQSKSNRPRCQLVFEDKTLFYEITAKPEITLEEIKTLQYFPLFQYTIQKQGDKFDEDYYDYPAQRALKKERQELTQQAYSEFSGKDKASLLKKRLEEIEQIYKKHKYIAPELDVYTQIVANNNFTGFDKLYKNISDNKDKFTEIIKAILDHYSGHQTTLNTKELQDFEKEVTALQIYNPTSGKGQNKGKAAGASTSQIKLSWISETMKISGALTNMLCQQVKVGSSYDLKVIVPNFKKAEYQKLKLITRAFKKSIKGNTPLKIDILNLLIINKLLIEHTDEYHNFHAKNILNGLHSTYQKDLGQNKAVVNISELQTPSFLEFNSENEAKDWIEILDKQIKIIGGIEELNNSAQALIAYRTFLTSAHFESWAKFSFWYAENIMSKLSANIFVYLFKTSSLNHILKNNVMNDFKISEIITNEGFKQIAYAIRKSTVILQYTPKEKRKFEIRYGIVQALQNKSKSPSDLAEFIGEFIATYNAETARYSEKHGSNMRKNIRQNELDMFYSLLDKYPSKVIGALLASYGFALTESDSQPIPETVEALEIAE